MKTIKRKLVTKEFPARNSRHNKGERVPERKLLVAHGPTIKKGKLNSGRMEKGAGGKNVWVVDLPGWWNE